MSIKKDDGWRNYYQVTNSEGVTCGDMKCHRCKDTIEGNYLIRDRTNFKHRGNETDERYLYHRECSDNKTVWEDFDKTEVELANYINLKETQKKEVLDLIKKYELEVDDLFDINY
jgi:hypothetical protein